MAHEIGDGAWHKVMDHYTDHRIRPMEQLVPLYCKIVGQQKFINKYFNEDVLYMCSHQKIKRTIRQCDKSVRIYVNEVLVAQGKLNEKK